MTVIGVMLWTLVGAVPVLLGVASVVVSDGERTRKQLGRVLAYMADVDDHVQEAIPQNPHAHLLGTTVEARKYEASDWERFVVVAVGWHGSVCIRAVGYEDRPGFWLRKPGADRLREL